MSLSRRVLRTAASATFAMKAAADRARAEGRTLVDLGLGEPDFPTPAAIQEAAVRAMRAGHTRYTAVQGILPLRQAIADRYAAVHGCAYAPEQVLVSGGGKGALFAVMMALLNDGDEVLLFAPYWTSYPEQVKLAGGEPVAVMTRESEAFRPSAARLEAALTPRTRMVVLNSPANPTGALIARREWEGIAELAAARGLFVLSDEVYEEFVYDGEEPFSAVRLMPRLGELLIVVGSFSKPFAMTGWRVGYALGPREIIRGAATVQAHDASQAPTISQYAALEAMTGSRLSPRAMIEEYAARRAYIVPALRTIPGFTCATPMGAFYAFPGVQGACRALETSSSEDLAMRLLGEAGVVTVPGEGFGAPGHLRVSYAASLSNLQEAVRRITELLARRV